MSDFNRRTFLSSAVGGALAMQCGQVAKAEASERIQVGVMGAGGRAYSLINSFASNPNADVVAISDIDSRRFGKAVHAVEEKQGSKPKTIKDFRQMIDDPAIDVLVIGAPDFWHAIPTILACQAEKDVYVEKPDGHNMEEGKRMVAAQRKHKRVVQLGTQARTTARVDSAMEYIKSGKLGRCLMAKAWESGKQGAIGFPKNGTAPAEVDYDFWQGPTPKREFNPNVFHGRWRWFYDYGTGDLGNDGVHRLDMAYLALQTACIAQNEPAPSLPTRISALGGKSYFNDMQEWPDTLQVNYTFDTQPTQQKALNGETLLSPRLLSYEMRIWNPYPLHGETEGFAIYGDKAYLVMGNNRWRAVGPGNQILAGESGGNHEADHVQNFLECVKSRKKSNADLETVGHPSSVLCHAGNVAYRTQRTLTLDAETELFVNDKEANELRTRPEYRKPWVLPEV